MPSAFSAKNVRQFFKRPPPTSFVANDSTLSSTPTIRPLTRDMLKHPEVRKILIRYALLVLLAFSPVVVVAIALSFSEPTNAAKTAIYMTVLLVSFTATGYGGWKSYRYILQATEPPAPPRVQQPSRPALARVGSAVDAFSNEQRYYTHMQHAGSAQTLAGGSNENNDGRVLSLTPYNPPMPQPHVDYNPPYVPPVNMPQPHMLMDMPLPHRPEPAYTNQPRQDSAAYVPLKGNNASYPPVQGPVPNPPRFNIQPPSPPSRYAMPRRLSASVSHAEGLRKSEDAESPYDDDDSAQLYSFDKVTVTKDDNSRRMSRRSSRRHSVGSIPAAEWNEQSQYTEDYSALPTPNAAAINARNLNIPQGAIMQAQRPMLIPADQLSASHESSSGSPLRVTNDIALAPRRPSPPRQDLPPRPDDVNLSQVNDGYVEQWLDSSTQPDYHPSMRRIGRGMSTQSLAASSVDLVIPEKFAAPDATKIVKTTTKAAPMGRSIYGERGLIEDSNNNQSSATIDHLVSDMMASSVSNIGQGMAAVPVPAPRPALKSAGTFGKEAAGIFGTSNEEFTSKSGAQPHAAAASSSAATEQVPVPKARDLASHSRSALEPTNPFAASAISKPAPNQTAHEHLIDMAEGRQDNSGAADSRYFSAVSLPQPPQQAANTMNTFHENEEDDFLDDDDSDDGYASKLASPVLPTVGDNQDGTKWKTNSINFSNMAAELAKALTQPNRPHESLVSGPLAPSRDSVSIEVLTPDISPMHAQHVTTSIAQRAVVHGHPPKPKQGWQNNPGSHMSLSPTTEYGDPDHTTLNIK
ncbi:hypothetical protein GGI18_000013 [Coemansia linderi]|uniref:Uncharacterized protein n=1 Tax=Coemansia linderi TaxID=2663919 RepID=A0ACC1KQ86_9FUNG|nr:hypothetical protein GGI18_000013 [Coemansia linderi]